MESGRVSSSELARVVEQAGQTFNWGRSYRAVMSTTIGAVFAAVGLDEETARISVAPEEVDSQCSAIATYSERRGHSAATGDSYQRSWKRLSTIAHRWVAAGGDNAASNFWDTLEDLRDLRPKRLSHQRTDSLGDSEPSDSFTVNLSTGRATVALPDGVTDADLVVLVRTIVGRKR